MLQQGINEVSFSKWMAPAIFIHKKSGEIQLCVDYCELNKKTVKDTYPDEVQDHAPSFPHYTSRLGTGIQMTNQKQPFVGLDCSSSAGSCLVSLVLLDPSRD